MTTPIPLLEVRMFYSIPSLQQLCWDFVPKPIVTFVIFKPRCMGIVEIDLDVVPRFLTVVEHYQDLKSRIGVNRIKDL